MSNKGSGKSPFKFEYFVEFDKMFGDKPNVTPPVLAGSLQEGSLKLICNGK